MFTTTLWENRDHDHTDGDDDDHDPLQNKEEALSTSFPAWLFPFFCGYNNNPSQ